jgi:Arc/MetJ-type ribon-helix-helix transcriptional regulator
MKLSISLPDEEVDFIDSVVENGQYASRSAVIARAMRLLRSADLGEMYDDAFREWALSEDGAAWDATPSGEAGD